MIFFAVPSFLNGHGMVMSGHGDTHLGMGACFHANDIGNYLHMTVAQVGKNVYICTQICTHKETKMK